MLQAYNYKCVVASGAGTNMKVVKNMGKKYENFGRAPSLFCSTSTISRFGERFRDGQYS